MKSRSSFFAISLSALLLAASARAQAPAAAPTPPPATPSPAVEGGVTNRALPDRSRSTLEGLEPQPGGLTSDEVARRALAASAPVKEKRAQLEAANEKITQTTFQFFPRATLTASYTRLSPVSANFGSGALVGVTNPGPLGIGPCPGNPAQQCVLDSQGQRPNAQALALIFPVNNYLLSARLSIPLSDYVLRVADAAEAASSSREAAKLLLEATRLKVVSDARSLYFNWLRARAQAVIARNAVERTRARLDDAKASFSAGQISKADLLRIQALVANTELVATQHDSMVSLTTGQLAIIMEDPKPAYRVGEGIPELREIPEQSAEVVGKLIAEAQSRRLESRAIDETTKALHHGASSTRAGALPRVDAIGDVTYANPNQRIFPLTETWNATWSAGIQATWTIGDTFLNSAAARELDAQARATEAQKKALHAGIAQEVLGAFLDLTRAHAALEQQKAALAAAEEGYRVTVDLFRAGRATGTELTVSESELLDAKIGDVNARIDLTIATIALHHATARDIASSPKTAAN